MEESLAGTKGVEAAGAEARGPSSSLGRRLRGCAACTASGQKQISEGGGGRAWARAKAAGAAREATYACDPPPLASGLANASPGREPR